MTVVYHICKPEDEGDYSKGYIGVAEDLEARLDRHFGGYSGASLLFRAIKKYKELSYAIIYEGPREQMLYVEEYLRPVERMGWNLAPGGGNPPSHKGVPKTEEHKAKIGASNRIAKSTGTWIVKGEKFVSCTAAAEATGYCKRTIIKWCKNGLHDCSFIPK